MNIKNINKISVIFLILIFSTMVFSAKLPQTIKVSADIHLNYQNIQEFTESSLEISEYDVCEELSDCTLEITGENGIIDYTKDYFYYYDKPQEKGLKNELKEGIVIGDYNTEDIFNSSNNNLLTIKVSFNNGNYVLETNLSLKKRYKGDVIADNYNGQITSNHIIDNSILAEDVQDKVLESSKFILFGNPGPTGNVSLTDFTDNLYSPDIFKDNSLNGNKIKDYNITYDKLDELDYIDFKQFSESDIDSKTLEVGDFFIYNINPNLSTNIYNSSKTCEISPIDVDKDLSGICNKTNIIKKSVIDSPSVGTKNLKKLDLLYFYFED